MSTHHFTLIVDGELQDESVVNGLFESGCDDALVGSRDGVQFLDFDRDAASLGEAVLSAVADAQRVNGVQVVRVAGLATLREIAERTGRRQTSSARAEVLEESSAATASPSFAAARGRFRALPAERRR